jgi:hypothetical protein
MIIPDKKKAVGIIISKMKPDGSFSEGGEAMQNEEEMDSDMEAKKSIAADIIEAMHSKSAHDLMVALEAFFEECDREPHEEGPHVESED